MVVTCIVKNCSTKSKNKAKLSLHEIPCSKREEWIRIIMQNGGLRDNIRNIGDHASVCELHFTTDSYYCPSGAGGKKRLRKDAVPNNFKFRRLDCESSK